MAQSRVKPGKRMFSLLAAALLVAVGYAAAFRLPGTDAQSADSYTGCVNRATGQLRVNLKGDTCSPSEVRIEIGSGGPGPQGPPGPPGEQGPPGEPGGLLGAYSAYYSGEPISMDIPLGGSEPIQFPQLQNEIGDIVTSGPGGTQFQLAETGTYRIDFILYGSGFTPGVEVEVVINGTPVEPSFSSGNFLILGDVQLSGTVLLDFVAGDVVSVEVRATSAAAELTLNRATLLITRVQ